ncbi:concanavalin A-like lectin glucanase [Lecanosticta acicola]|uniref:Concanavalin A-like lectin glucanase n=1 Tax=Lecanosticta acicola TaxID=111012 RepID=A0AAI9EFT6_9PEZI|nr:concanavalin A-like lectin glucanase [Lecanosticta acicola]
MGAFRNLIALGLLGLASANPVELQRRAVTVTATSTVFYCTDNSRPTATIGARDVVEKRATTTTSPPAATGTVSNIVCPSMNQTTVTSNGKSFLIECGIDHAGGDLANQPVYVADLAGCLNACAAQPLCVDAVLSGTACYMKGTVGARVYDGVNGARLLPSASSGSSTTTTTTITVSSPSSTPASFYVYYTTSTTTFYGSLVTPPEGTGTVVGFPQQTPGSKFDLSNPKAVFNKNAADIHPWIFLDATGTAGFPLVCTACDGLQCNYVGETGDVWGVCDGYLALGKSGNFSGRADCFETDVRIIALTG